MNKFNLTTQTLIKTPGSLYEGYRLGDAIKDAKFLGWCSSHIDRIQTSAGPSIDIYELDLIERYQALIRFAEENKPKEKENDCSS
jgi:hypothetical protein